MHRTVSCFDTKEERGGTGREKERSRKEGRRREGREEEGREREGGKGRKGRMVFFT